MTYKEPFLVSHLKSTEPVSRFPVWMMRQAGRYLPSYRAIREKYSFWEMVSNAEVAAKVTLLPFETLKVDAAIFFSDILTLPYGLKIPIAMKEKIGPVVLEPLRTLSQFKIFEAFAPETHTDFVGQALKIVRRDLPSEKALIGFCGAPWTVGCYLVEGQGKNGFPYIQKWMQEDPRSLADSFHLLKRATVEYLKFQVASGAEVVQVFDTWASLMSENFFREFYFPCLQSLFKELKPLNIPRIYFGKKVTAFLPYLKELDCEVMGVDENTTLTAMENALEGKYSLQGNLNPEVLLTTPDQVRRQTRLLVEEARGLNKPAILNLGHGITPQTPIENAQAFVEEASTLWI